MNATITHRHIDKAQFMGNRAYTRERNPQDAADAYHIAYQSVMRAAGMPVCNCDLCQQQWINQDALTITTRKETPTP